MPTPICASCCPSTTCCPPCASPCSPCCPPRPCPTCPLNQNISPVLSTALNALKTSGGAFNIVFAGNPDPVPLSDLASVDCVYAAAQNDGRTFVFALDQIDSILVP